MNQTLRKITLILTVLLAAVGCSSYPSAIGTATPAPPPITTLQVEAVQPDSVVTAEPVATNVPPTAAFTPAPLPTETPLPTATLPPPTAEPVVEESAAAPESDSAEESAVEAAPAENSSNDGEEAAATEPDSAENTPVPPTEEPAPPPPLGITLSSPIENARVVAGTALSVSGEATSVDLGQSILVELIHQNVGSIQDVNLVAQEGRWSALLPAPEAVVGPMLVRASVRDANGTVLTEATQPVELVVNEGSAENYIQINSVSPIAIAGKGIHLTGTASSTNPIFKINLGVFFNNCSETGGLVSFDMYANGYWEGYLTLPEYASGDICVYAFTGSLGGPDQQLAQVPLFAMQPEDENAIGVVIANPRPSINVLAPFSVDGIAYNPPNGIVTVAARLPNGTVLWEDRVIPDRFGYWQAFVPIEAGEYAAEIVAFIGDADNPIQATHPINVVTQQ